MKKPNDMKRPNTHSGREDKQRRLNLRYFWVSKPLITVPHPEMPEVKLVIPVDRGITYNKKVQL